MKISILSLGSEKKLRLSKGASRSGVSLSLIACLLGVSVAAPSMAQENSSSSSATVSSSSGDSSAEVNLGKLPSTNEVDRSSSKKFGISFYTLGGVDDAALRDLTKTGDGASYTIYDSYISFNYKPSKDLRFALRPAFGYTTAGLTYRGPGDTRTYDNTNKIIQRDFSIAMAQYNFLEDYMPSNLSLKSEFRLYLPTSDGSKAEGMIARLRYEIEGRYYIGRYDHIRYFLKPSYYFQRNRVSQDSFGNLRTTKDFDVVHGGEYNYNLNKTFSIKPGFEVEDNWSHASSVNKCGSSLSPCEGNRKTTIDYRLGLEVRVAREFNFTLGIGDKRDLINTSRSKQVGYTLLTNAVLF